MQKIIQEVTLQWDKAPTKKSPKYNGYADVFYPDLTNELIKNTGLNKHAIELVNDKRLSYRSIYTLSPMELEIM